MEKSEACDTYWVMSRYCRPIDRETPSMFVYGSVWEKLYTFEYLPPATSTARRSPLPMKFEWTKLPLRIAPCDSE